MMKRFLFLLAGLFLLSGYGGEAKQDDTAAAPSAASVQATPVVLEVLTPGWGGGSTGYSLWNMDGDEKVVGEFQIMGTAAHPSAYYREELAPSCPSSGVYEVDGLRYTEPVRGDVNRAICEWYAWFADAAFFTLYAKGEPSTLDAAYCCPLLNSMEVLVGEHNSERLILAEEASSLHDYRSYRAADFGVCVIGSRFIGAAADFDWLLDAHLRGEDIEPVTNARFDALSAEGQPGDLVSGQYPVVFESTRYPGLRYVFYVTYLYADGNYYVYSRADDCMGRLTRSLGI